MEQNIKVFIADSNPDFIQDLKEYLEKEGNMTVVGSSSNGKEALDMIHKTRPDVVALDILLPSLDGIAVLMGMRGISPEDRPHVIMITAFSNENILGMCLQHGADYYMVKPAEMSVIKERIELVASLSRTIQVNITNPIPAASTVTKRHTMEVTTTNMLLSLGVPANIKGYQYVREAIVLSIETPDLINAVTKQLYPLVASKFDTAPTRVERAIRHAIETACVRGNEEQIFNVFGYTMNNSKCKPTNSEFIAMIADKLRLELTAG